MNYNRFNVKVISFFTIVILLGLILSGCSSGGPDDEKNVVETTSISGTVMVPAGNPVDQEVSFLGNLFARAHAFVGDTPLKDAEIIIKDLADQKVLKTAVTDDNGKYTITGLKKGIDVIIIVTKEFKDGSKVRMSGIIPNIGQQTEIDGYIDAATTIFTELFQYERETTNLTDIDMDYIKTRVERVEEVVQKEMDKNGGNFNLVVNNEIISENFGDGIKDEFLKKAVEEAYKKPKLEDISDQNVNVNEEIKIQVNAVDLDGDLISYDVKYLNSFEGASFVNKEFIWAPSQKGHYEITFISSDGTYTDEKTISINVDGENIPPVATNDSETVNENATILIDVLANDTDVDGDILSISGFTQGTNGTVTQEGDSLRYTPDANYNGADSFMYEVSDGNGGIATATVEITINPIGLTLSGNVIDDMGLTLTEQTLSLYDRQYSPDNPTYLTVKIDANGDYQFINLLVGEYTLATLVNGFIHTFPVEIIDGDNIKNLEIIEQKETSALKSDINITESNEDYPITIISTGNYGFRTMELNGSTNDTIIEIYDINNQLIASNDDSSNKPFSYLDLEMPPGDFIVLIKEKNQEPLQTIFEIFIIE